MKSLSRRKFLVGLGVLTGGAVVGAWLEVDEAGAAPVLPDLIITQVIIPSGLTAGQPVQFGMTTLNQGRGATPAGAETEGVFRVDGVQVSLSSTDQSSLAAGASITLYANSGGVNGGGTWTATAGTHTLEAIINYGNRYPETSTSNNAAWVSFTVAANTQSATPTAASTPIEAVPLAASDIFVGNPQTATDGTPFSTTATSDQPFTLTILESADGITNTVAIDVTATQSGSSYSATASVIPTQKYLTQQVTNGATAMTQLTLSQA